MCMENMIDMIVKHLSVGVVQGLGLVSLFLDFEDHLQISVANYIPNRWVMFNWDIYQPLHCTLSSDKDIFVVHPAMFGTWSSRKMGSNVIQELLKIDFECEIWGGRNWKLPQKKNLNGFPSIFWHSSGAFHSHRGIAGWFLLGKIPSLEMDDD